MSVEIKKLRANYEIRFPYNSGLIALIKSLPADQKQTKMNSLQKEDGTVFKDWFHVVNIAGLNKIIDYIKQNNLHFKFINLTPEEIDKFKNDYLERQKHVNDVLQLKTKELDVSNFEMPNLKIEPYIYQKQAVLFFEKAGGKCILGDQPGTGKTIMAIAYAVKHRLKTLIICPSSLRLNWRAEIEKFTDEKSYVYNYKPKKRSNEITYSKDESLFHIISYDGLDSFIKIQVSHTCSYHKCGWKEINHKKKYKECPSCNNLNTIKSRVAGISFQDKDGNSLIPENYDLLVCDEAHYLKNPKSNRTKVVKKAFANAPKKLLLTGTAIKSFTFEFFPLLNFIDPNEFKSEHVFGVKFCAGFQDNFGWNYSGLSNEAELYERIAPFFIRRLKSDVLKFLPPKTFTHIPIELSPEEYREYKSIEKNVSEDSDENSNDATHLTNIQKFKMFTSHAKAHRAFEIIQNIIESGEKIVVFAEFVSTAEKIKEHFGEKAVLFTGKKNITEKNEAVTSFMNDEKIQIFVGTIGSASVGLTLTVASIALFIDQPWTPSDREQAEDRIHRASTTADKVQIIRLICKDTIDEDIIKLLEEKEKVVSKVLDAKIFDKQIDKLQGSIFKDLVKIILNKKVE